MGEAGEGGGGGYGEHRNAERSEDERRSTAVGRGKFERGELWGGRREAASSVREEEGWVEMGHREEKGTAGWEESGRRCR